MNVVTASGSSGRRDRSLLACTGGSVWELCVQMLLEAVTKPKDYFFPLLPNSSNAAVYFDAA